MSDQNKPPEGGKEPAAEPTGSSDPVPFSKDALKKKFRDGLLGTNTPEPEPEPTPDPNDPTPDPVDPVDPEPTDPTPDPDPADPADPDDDDDLNLDDDPVDPEPTDPTPEPDDDPLDKNIVKLRKKYEDLDARYSSQEEKLTETMEELDRTKKELEKYNLTQVDPKSHPDFITKSKDTENKIYSRLTRLKGVPDAADKLGQRWGDILTDVDHYESAPREEKAGILSDLRVSIAQQLGMVSADTEYLDPSIDIEAVEAADKVIDVFEPHTSDYKELARIFSDIQTKAADNRLETGFNEYQNTTKPIREALAVIDTMSEQDIEEDPTSLQALAAKKIASSPEMKTKAAKIDKYLIEMAFGPEALSQEELDRHHKSGKDMDEFHASRNKRVKQFREQRLPEIKAMMILLPQIKEALPEFFNTEGKKEKAAAQKKAIRRSTGTTPKEPAKKEDEQLTGDQLRERLRKNLLGG